MPYQHASLANGIGQSIKERAERFGQRTLAFEQRLGELQASRRGGHLFVSLAWDLDALAKPRISSRRNAAARAGGEVQIQHLNIRCELCSRSRSHSRSPRTRGHALRCSLRPAPAPMVLALSRTIRVQGCPTLHSPLFVFRKRLSVLLFLPRFRIIFLFLLFPLQMSMIITVFCSIFPRPATFLPARCERYTMSTRVPTSARFPRRRRLLMSCIMPTSLAFRSASRHLAALAFCPRRIMVCEFSSLSRVVLYKSRGVHQFVCISRHG